MEDGGRDADLGGEFEDADVEIFDIPIREAAAALIIADEAGALGELGPPVAPDGVDEIVFEMAEPVGGFDERRAIADLRPGEGGAVGGFEKTDLLIEGKRGAGCGWTRRW